ncbi:MAG: RES family NAD+ phosphorylase [Gemmatimonadetes bacterium]|nr:RES family NAD+ phosphorylase [Gemmatimonadota bacterium]
MPHGFPYAECQALALAVWEHADGVDGIEYRSRWDDSRLCIALFDRAADAVGAPGPAHPLDTPALVRPILRHYGIGAV